jgi:hypothetical protein
MRPSRFLPRFREGQAGRGVFAATGHLAPAAQAGGDWLSTFAGAILGEFPRTASCGSCGRGSGFSRMSRGGGPVGG